METCEVGECDQPARWRIMQTNAPGGGAWEAYSCDEHKEQALISTVMTLDAAPYLD